MEGVILIMREHRRQHRKNEQQEVQQVREIILYPLMLQKVYRKDKYTEVSCHLHDYGLAGKYHGMELVKYLRNGQSYHYKGNVIEKEPLRRYQLKEIRYPLFYLFHGKTPIY